MGDSHGEQKALTKLVDLQGKPQSRRCFLLTGKRQTTHLQERQAGSGELQAGQLHLAPQENYGANLHRSHERQEGD